jgi:hydroxypyruvate reductase
VASYGLEAALPQALREGLARGDLPSPIGRRHPVFSRSTIERTLGNEHARQCLQQAALDNGIHVVVDPIDDVPFAHASEHLLTRLRQLRREHGSGPVAVLNGGEVTVQLPAKSGHGGRNQQFALQCALRCEGEPITVLSAGTDGIDGNSPAAGAVADGDTAARAAAQGLDAALQLRHCDAFPLFHRLGDAIVTGPTGTNVRDLRLLIHE